MISRQIWFYPGLNITVFDINDTSFYFTARARYFISETAFEECCHNGKVNAR